MSVKLFDSELKVMELLWKEGELSAKKIAELLKEQINWSKTTTYTVIKKCIQKNAILRVEPGFLCQPLITIDEVRKDKTSELVKKMYNGSPDLLIASLLEDQTMTPEEISHLKKIVNDLK